jgi:hypothetical protein
MEGAGWWGEWWESRKNDRKPTASVTGAEIRYTKNETDRAGERDAAMVM